MEQKSKTKTSTPIHLTDVGRDVRIVEKPLKKAKIKTTLQGFEISIPTVKNKLVRTSWLFLFAGACILGGLGVWLLFLGLLGQLTRPREWGMLGLFLGSAISSFTSLIMAKSVFGKEKIMLSKKTLKIGNYIFGKSKLRIGQEQTYDITKISNLRLVSQEHGLHGKNAISFDYGDQTVGFCKNVGATEASVLLKHLSDIIAFRCYSTEFIIFGSYPFENYNPDVIIFGSYPFENYNPDVMLQNPDVSELTFPFVRLRRVVIHTETYDFHQVERFLTYAVNYIGQDYLKEHVEVAVYGDPEKLHPNLRNSFDNLCKRVNEC